MLMNLLAVYLGQHFRNLAVGGNDHAIQLALVGSGHQTVSCGTSLAIGGILRRDTQIGDVILGHRSGGGHMALFIHGGLVQAAGSSGVGGMDILVCASRNAVQLILEGRSEVLVRQALACFLFNITGQVNETSQHIVLIGIADLDHHDIGALGIFVARALNKVGGSSESIGDIVHIAQNALRQRGQFSKGYRASRLIDSADLGVDLILGVGRNRPE